MPSMCQAPCYVLGRVQGSKESNVTSTTRRPSADLRQQRGAEEHEDVVREGSCTRGLPFNFHR